MLRRTLNDPLGFLAREPFLALQVFAEPSRAHREIAREDGDAVLEDVHVGHFVTDVDETDDALHGVGMVQLEGVVNGERVDVDDGGIESGFAEQADAALDELALGSYEQDVHLEAFGVGIEDLEIELHVRHVERHVLLGFPPDDFAGIPFFHPVHLNLLDDDVTAPHGRNDGFALDAGGFEQPPNSLRNQAGVHDLALDDRIGGDFGCRDFGQLSFAAPMVNDHELDDTGADIQPD